MEEHDADKAVRREIGALLSNERLILRETKRSVWRGVAVFVAFLNKIGLRWFGGGMNPAGYSR